MSGQLSIERSYAMCQQLNVSAQAPDHDLGMPDAILHVLDTAVGFLEAAFGLLAETGELLCGLFAKTREPPIDHGYATC